MDIKKFISSDKIDNDYNKMIQLEIDAIKNKNLEKDNNKCLFKVSECDFLKPKELNNDDITDFKKKISSSLDDTNLAFTGPMIKCKLDPTNNNLPINNYYYVALINTKINPKDLIKEDLDTKNGYYVIKTTNSIFYLDKKTSNNISSYILSNNDNLDRIALFNNELWVSGMFILEFYKRISCYDSTLVDPIFGYSEDILNIYDRKFVESNTIKNMIDMIKIDKIQELEKEKIENTFIVLNDQKYTIIEYVLYKMMEDNIHPIISYHLNSMLLYLNNFQYLRPIFFVAKMLKVNEKYPALYENLINVKHSINIDSSTDTLSLISIYHIDMFILNHFIKTDDNSKFIDYITRIGIIKKFKQDSKTIEKIIEWIIEFKSIKIISTLTEAAILTDQHKYKIIFMTQEFNLFGTEFLNKYLLDAENNELEEVYQNIILDILPLIIDNGYTRSFYSALKLCKNLLNPTILHLINKDLSVDILEIILKKNKDLIDQKADQGKTPLIIYAERGLSKCISKILEYGADYELIDNNSDTFLHKLCISGRHDIVQSVIRHVTNIIDLQNDMKMTPSILATFHKHEEIFYILKGVGANLELTDIYGNTPYHYICRSKICPGIIIINKKNKFGFTPFDYCCIDHKFYYFQK